jgi:hypothetical protein
MPDKLYEDAITVFERKAKVPVRLAWRAFVPAYPRRSRDLATLPSSPLPAPYVSSIQTTRTRFF